MEDMKRSDATDKMTNLKGKDFLPSIGETLEYLLKNPDMDDLLYLGGSISAKSLVLGYTKGLFPMMVETGDNQLVTGWFSPRTRAVIDLKPDASDLEIKISKSLRKSMRGFVIRKNERFDEVVHQCATVRSEGNWIDANYESTYAELHREGFAHSYEVYLASDPDRLVGGLFGVGIGHFFSGESMFHLLSDASKASFVYMVDDLRSNGYRLLDGQWQTHHLKSLGFTSMSRTDYLRKLRTFFD